MNQAGVGWRNQHQDQLIIGLLSLPETNSGLLSCLLVHINKTSYKQGTVLTCIATVFNSCSYLRGLNFGWSVDWSVGFSKLTQTMTERNSNSHTMSISFISGDD